MFFYGGVYGWMDGWTGGLLSAFALRGEGRRGDEITTVRCDIVLWV